MHKFFLSNKYSSSVLKAAIILFLVFSFVHTKAKELVRPIILVTPAERSMVLNKIENQDWAKEIYTDFIKRLDRDIQMHKKSPEKFLKQLPYNWEEAKPGSTPPFFLTRHLGNGEHSNLDNATDAEFANARILMKFLNYGVNCGMAYYVTQDEKYAQCATDILHAFVQGVLQSEVSDWHSRGGWLFPDDGFREVREIGAQVPLIYDFVAEFIKKGGQPYDIVQNKKVNFSVDDAQQVFRTYADITINYGHTGSNHPVLEAPSLVYNALAMNDEAERTKLLSYFLTENTENQDALNTMAAIYKEEGDIWPETSQYLNAASSIITRLMLIVDRYDPSLHLAAKYKNVLYALPKLDDLVYPNNEIIRWGDGHRHGSAPYSSYEDAYVLGKMDGLEKVTQKFGPLINRAMQQGKYKRKGMNAIFWYDNEIVGDVESIVLPRTDRVYHAGIFLQRNLSTTKNPVDGLMCFVGGAHMIHGHAEGMNIELYGKGQVLGVDNGRGNYQQDIHENYSRIFAAHNTVIVNGSSQGEGEWANLGINTVQLISMEPEVGAQAVSPNYSFTQTSFVDDGGDKAEAVQERTLALIRTSPTTGYYVDVFRSKSNLPNEYHDYLYHNIGDKLSFKNNDLQLKDTPERYRDNADGVWKQNNQFRNPGWHFFKNVQSSSTYNADVQAIFSIEKLKTDKIYMGLHIPGFDNREYTKVMAPHTFEAPKPYEKMETPTLVIRQKGEAWKKPFVVVYEPFDKNSQNQTIQSVEKLEQNGLYKGLKIKSKIDDQTIVQYIITQSEGEEFNDAKLGIHFKGTFAVISCNDKMSVTDMYIGAGEQLTFGKASLSPKTGEKSAYEDFKQIKPNEK